MKTDDSVKNAKDFQEDVAALIGEYYPDLVQKWRLTCTLDGTNIVFKFDPERFKITLQNSSSGQMIEGDDLGVVVDEYRDKVIHFPGSEIRAKEAFDKTVKLLKGDRDHIIKPMRYIMEYAESLNKTK